MPLKLDVILLALFESRYLTCVQDDANRGEEKDSRVHNIVEVKFGPSYSIHSKSLYLLLRPPVLNFPPSPQSLFSQVIRNWSSFEMVDRRFREMDSISLSTLDLTRTLATSLVHFGANCLAIL